MPPAAARPAHGDAGVRPAHVGFVIEPILGHLTHAQNLVELIPDDYRVRSTFFLVPFEVEGLAARVPLYRSNWSLRAGWRTRRALSRMAREEPLDALFIHTQVPAVLSANWLRRVPTVLSVDATPRQYDELGEQYDHGVDRPVVERLKHKLNARCFERARHVVAWSQWAKDGVVRDYGLPPDRVTVIAPGVDIARWSQPPPPTEPAVDDTVRILFVGGDLERKGGLELLAATRALRDRTDPDGPAVELHLVTKAEPPPEPGLVVHRGLTPNSEALVSLYHRADIFCLPTRGDCLPMVLSEAGAAGLPVVSTDVGGIGDIVKHGETGYLVPVGGVDDLTAHLAKLVADPSLRRRLGDAGRALVQAQFDARRNAETLVDLLIAVAASDASND